MPRWDSNPQSQQASGRRTTPQIVRSPCSASSRACLSLYHAVHTPKTYHRNCYEDAQQDDQTDAVPRERRVCWFPGEGPVGAGRGYIARHPASPETEQNTNTFCICSPHYSDLRRMINVIVSFRLRPRHPNGKSGR